MTRSRAVWIGLMALTVAACSGGGSADPTVAPSTAAATTSTSTTAPASPSSTTSVTTTVPPPTVAPTTSPTTSPPTTTQVDPTDAVIADFLAAWQAFNAFTLDPTDDLLADAVKATFAGEALDRFDETVAFYRDNNYRAVEDPDLPASVTVLEDTVVVVDEFATFTVCDLDSNTLVEVGSLPDGGDAVINEAVVARLSDVSLRLDDGTWRVLSNNVIEEFPGSATCEA